MIRSGKTAVITGSNSGIGLGVAEELARAGADVVLNSFTDRPEDHAIADDPAICLCSPAADQVTGTTISVDGGWTAL